MYVLKFIVLNHRRGFILTCIIFLYSFLDDKLCSDLKAKSMLKIWTAFEQNSQFVSHFDDHIMYILMLLGIMMYTT